MKIHGTRVTTKTASAPPTAYAAQRRRAASAASGRSSNAATAIAPERPKSSGTTENRSDVPSSWPSYCSKPRSRSRSLGLTEAVSPITGSSHAKKAAMGTASATSASPSDTASRRTHRSRTARNPVNGTTRNSAYVGWTTAIANDAAAVDASTAGVGRRVASIASASAAGTSSWREAVAGSASAV